MNATVEINEGRRFGFGENWRRFLSTIDEQRIRIAEQDLQSMLGTDDLRGKRFLDIGSGSGLSSLAARRLGAEVESFDFDDSSVRCTEELKRRFFPDDPHWRVAQGDILDAARVERLGRFDVVYSWGVLHHTGQMWQAMDHTSRLVADGGQLFIAIYNDQGPISTAWSAVKRTYCRAPAPLKMLMVVGVGAVMESWAFARAVVTCSLPRWFAHRWNYKKNRGMSRRYDIIDWIGGYPFEVARPEEVFRFMRDRGFVLQQLATRSGKGCNLFVFEKASAGENPIRHERAA